MPTSGIISPSPGIDGGKAQEWSSKGKARPPASLLLAARRPSEGRSHSCWNRREAGQSFGAQAAGFRRHPVSSCPPATRRQRSTLAPKVPADGRWPFSVLRTEAAGSGARSDEALLAEERPASRSCTEPRRLSPCALPTSDFSSLIWTCSRTARGGRSTVRGPQARWSQRCPAERQQQGLASRLLNCSLYRPASSSHDCAFSTVSLIWHTAGSLVSAKPKRHSDAMSARTSTSSALRCLSCSSASAFDSASNACAPHKPPAPCCAAGRCGLWGTHFTHALRGGGGAGTGPDLQILLCRVRADQIGHRLGLLDVLPERRLQLLVECGDLV
jgi:hypothetical protein